MIITKTPFRVSFIGGGTDFKYFYEQNYGEVISCSVDKYMFINLNDKFDKKIKISYSKVEHHDDVNDVLHPLVKECLKYFDIKNNIEISSIADIPSSGSGLGSSSAYTVGLINGLSRLKKEPLSLYKIASIACDIEINKCKEPIGIQDQFAVTFGGLKNYYFNSNGNVEINDIANEKKIIDFLNENLLFFYTGISRKSSHILAEQSNNIKSKKLNNDLDTLLGLVKEFKIKLTNLDLDSIGKIIHESWLLKKGFSHNITNSIIDDFYQTAQNHGAIGGKLLGAGHGGFLMFIAKKENHEAIVKSLKPLIPYKFNLITTGTEVVYNDKKDY